MTTRAALVWTILALGSASPVTAGMAPAFNPHYQFCIRPAGNDDGIDCRFTSMDLCRLAAGRAGQCMINPFYVYPDPPKVESTQRSR
jgi:hypothetical protein